MLPIQVVAIYNAKTGIQQSMQSIKAFFNPPSTSGNFVFDPRCAHQPAYGYLGSLGCLI